jgi:predicted metal-binding membrane protein
VSLLTRLGSRAAPLASLEGVGWGVASAAWAALVVGSLRGWSVVLDHHHLVGGHLRVGIGDLAGFLAAWQLMVAAMMLPTALPMIRLFERVSRSQPRPRLTLATFVGAYLAVWTAFAVAALFLDLLLHALVHEVPWLALRPDLITGTVLVGAGAFQFTPSKHRCLDACRNALHFVWRYYRRGIGGAWLLGVRHGAFCVGCCWALMLVMFAVGVGSLAWMVALSGVMLVEKTSTWGRRLVPLVGVALLVSGGAMVLRVWW